MKTYLAGMLLCLPSVVMANSTHNDTHSMDMDHAQHGQMAVGMDDAMSAIGHPGNPAQVNRTIDVVMDDGMRFTPSQIQVNAGDTVRFFIKNTGKLTHEMVLGSIEDLKEHAEKMRKMPDMVHSEPNMITLKAGQRGGLIWSFTEPGKVNFACLVPGHMQAGMKGIVQVK